jgi:hypothetical protein
MKRLSIFMQSKMLKMVAKGFRDKFTPILYIASEFYSRKLFLSILCLSVINVTLVSGQQSVARKWNEVLLEGIRNDYARPTVHARNLFHTSIALYDTWAAYDSEAKTYLLGQNIGGYDCPFNWIPVSADKKAAREEAMSFAAYRLLKHRFGKTPGAAHTIHLIDSLFSSLGFNPDYISTDYTSNVPAAIGNYLAQCIIEFGLQDGSNEINDYSNLHYDPLNPPLFPKYPGNPDLMDANRWQPLSLDVFIDQSGNEIPFNTPEFLSPEWGDVIPFSLSQNDLTVNVRAGIEYRIYHDPGPPPQLLNDGGGLTSEYLWGFTTVALWSAHLDPNDSVLWDISPASMGNIKEFPVTMEGLRDFYNYRDGGDPGTGYSVNPSTGEPYVPQIVPRGDYTRVLAEFWADGPDSETPPGHWYTILNYVSDHPEFEQRFKGEGPVMDDLEWDVKSYLALGGAMHDAAISAWGIKGWYDYIRPVSAIRHMAEMGQSSDPDLPGYSENGIPLAENLIELVEEGDILAGVNNENINKIKLYAWKGPDYIEDPETNVAGVGWILAENWWPYQRPSFVTPPFAGYVSGHSTFSRAAAEVLTLITGDPFFPGGKGEFEVKKNEFLVFEDGPSVDLTLEWATYRDASDQTSLSRIWGGIHPPADDIPGRIIGEKIGIQAFEYAENLFTGKVTALSGIENNAPDIIRMYPNPAIQGNKIIFESESKSLSRIRVYNSQGRIVHEYISKSPGNRLLLSTEDLAQGLYFVSIQLDKQSVNKKLILK